MPEFNITRIRKVSTFTIKASAVENIMKFLTSGHAIQNFEIHAVINYINIVQILMTLFIISSRYHWLTRCIITEIHKMSTTLNLISTYRVCQSLQFK